MGGVKKTRGGRTTGKRSARQPVAKPKGRGAGKPKGVRAKAAKHKAVKPKAARTKTAKRTPVKPKAKATKPKATKTKPTKARSTSTKPKPKGTKATNARAARPKAPKPGRQPTAPAKKTSRGRPAPVREVVRIRDLDPYRKCGPGTSVERLIRVDEKVGRELEAHLVFLDRHGWYCEHGRSCPAVGHARRHAQHAERPEW